MDTILYLELEPKAFSLLAEQGSLTQRFKQAMGSKPNLTRLYQGRQFVSSDERQMLAIKPRQMAMVREIKMGNIDQAWLFARTVVPLKTLLGSARRICALDETPIGKILFGRQGAERKSMKIELTSDLPKTLIDMDINIEHPLWERCSIFEFSAGPLMVSEIFLPDCPVYKHSNNNSSAYAA